MKPSDVAAVAGLCLLVAGAPALGAPAAPSAKPAPVAVQAAPPPPAASAIVQRAAQPEAALRGQAERAKQLESDVRALSEERRVLRQSIQTGRRELTRQLETARRAKKRHDAAAAKPAGKPQPADLEAARQGFGAALVAGKQLEQQGQQLRDIEQKLEQRAAQARELEASLKAASSEFKAVDRELGPALGRVETQLGSARSAAQQARTQSGFAWQSYATAKAKTDKALAGTDAALAMLAQEQKELAAAERALAAAPAPAAAVPPGKCNIEQLPWDKMKSLPGHGELTRSEEPSDTQESVTQVLYGDLDANGVSEAFVTLSTHYGTNNGETTLYVYTMDSSCTLQTVAQIQLPGGCTGSGEVSVSGRRLTIKDIPVIKEEDTEGRCMPTKFRSEEYALQKGKLELVKSTGAK